MNTMRSLLQMLYNGYARQCKFYSHDFSRVNANLMAKGMGNGFRRRHFDSPKLLNILCWYFGRISGIYQLL
jgi:hypothetical protein